MLKSDILKKLELKHKNLSENDIEQIFNIFIKKIVSALENDKNVELRGFGTLKKKVNKAKEVRNPKTNEKLYKKENYKLHFKTGKILHSKLNSNWWLMNKKIIVALDLGNINKAIKVVKELKKEAYAFKIGHEFFYNFGIAGYKKIYKICPRIFLDLKLHDIPNTVQKGLKAILKLKPIFTTIHISGGDDMQKLSILKNNKKTNILGVTILTSLDKKQTLKYYKEKNINSLVKKFANYAKKIILVD